jgi:hypothetical protein
MPGLTAHVPSARFGLNRRIEEIEMLLLTLYVMFTLLVGIGAVRLYRLLAWRHGPGEELGGQAGAYGRMTVRTQQGFINLFENDRRGDRVAQGNPPLKRQRKARPGNIKRPWGW